MWGGPGHRRPSRLASSARLRPRNGPPLAVSTMRATRERSPLALAARHWCTAQCSESTGTMWPAPGRSSTERTTGPPAISDSLLASARRRPAASAARVTRRPAKPTTPLTHTSATAPRSANAASPARTSVPAGDAVVDGGGATLVADDHQLGMQLVGLAHESVGRRPGAERHDLEPVGLGPHHVDGLGPDRSGRPGDRDRRQRHPGTLRSVADRRH